jgi:uridine kinase
MLRHSSFIKNKNNKMIILISGITASGKSNLAKNISKELYQKRKLSNIVLSQDDFRLLKVHPDKEDSFESFDFDLLIKCVNLFERENPPYKLQKYNFQTDSYYETLINYKPKIIIIEGTYTLFEENLLKVADYKIFLKVEKDICLARRLIRDVKKRHKTFEEILLKYVNYIRPTIKNIIIPSSKKADLIVNVNSSIEDIVNKIINRMN